MVHFAHYKSDPTATQFFCGANPARFLSGFISRCKLGLITIQNGGFMQRYLIALAVFMSCGAKDKGEDNPAPEAFPSYDGDIELEELTTTLPDIAEPTLIGGTPASPADWLATVYSSQGNSRCSATVVGPRTLAIAAHCVGNGKTATFSVLGKKYVSSCTHSRLYAGNSTADWALCLVTETVTGIKYEVVGQDPALVKVGDELLLTGYGCTQPGGTGGNDGVYRTGKAKVTQVPSGNSNDIVTKGGAALCFGDSGGPAFVVMSDGMRYQVSINSRGDIRTTSYLSALFTDAAKDFYAKWSDLNKAVICGVHKDVPDCRTGKPKPEPEPEPQPEPEPSPLPAYCKATLEKMNLCLYGKPPHAQSDSQGCHEALGKLAECQGLAEKPKFD